MWGGIDSLIIISGIFNSNSVRLLDNIRIEAQISKVSDAGEQILTHAYDEIWIIRSGNTKKHDGKKKS